MIMNEGLKNQIEGVKSELRALFPQGEIELVEGQNPYDDSHPYDDYVLIISGNSSKRIAYLKMRFYGGDEILEVQLFKDNQYQIDRNIWGISWFVSEDGKYKKPDDYQELERFVDHIWGILR